jgi:hypothetical protein
MQHIHIKYIHYCLLLALIASMLTACRGDKTLDKKAVAEYKGETLYMYELDRHVPKDQTGNDSIESANTYIEEWLTNQALANRAKKEIPNLEERLELEVKAAKMSLTRKEFQEWLIKQVDSVITYQQMKDYYSKYPDRFKSNTTLYQYLYIKTIETNPSQVVSWMNSNAASDLAKLTQWCETGKAIEYRTDSSVVTQTELKRISDGYYGNLEKAKMNTVHTYTSKEEGKTYTNFFRLIKVIEEGQTIPFSGSKTKIQENIMNVRVQELIIQTERTLFEEAKNSPDFKKYMP